MVAILIMPAKLDALSLLKKGMWIMIEISNTRKKFVNFRHQKSFFVTPIKFGILLNFDGKN